MCRIRADLSIGKETGVVALEGAVEERLGQIPVHLLLVRVRRLSERQMVVNKSRGERPACVQD